MPALEHHFGVPGLLTLARVDTPVFLIRGYPAPVAELSADGFPRQRWQHGLVAVTEGRTAVLELMATGPERPWWRLLFRALVRQGFTSARWVREQGTVLVPWQIDLRPYA